MKKIFSVLLFSCTFVVLFFLLLSDFEQEIAHHLQSPDTWLAYAGASFLVLVSDIILPIPSSLVMILNGKFLGLYYGALLSLVSGLISGVIGFYLGRRAGKFFNRFFSRKELEAGNRLFLRYGKLSIALSKALPVLSESVSFLAGTTSMPFRTFLLYSFIGQSVVALVYAWLGSMTNAYDSNMASAIIIAGALVIAWLFQSLLAWRKEAVR